MGGEGMSRDVFLAQAASRIVRRLDFDGRLQEAAEAAVPYMADFCTFTIHDESGSLRRTRTVARDPATEATLRTLEAEYPPLRDEKTPGTRVFATGEPILIPTVPPELVASVARDARQKELILSLGIRSACLVPVRARDRIVGVLSLTRSLGPPYDEHDLVFATHYAQLVGLLLENGTIYEEQEGALRRHTSLHERILLLTEASTSLLLAPDLDEALDGVLGLAPRILSADAYALWHKAPPAGEWQILASKGLGERYRSAAPLRLDPASPPPSAPMVVDRARERSELSLLHDLYIEEGIESLLVVPLRARDRSFGTLAVYSHTPRAFDGLDIHLAQALANLAASAIENARLHEARARSAAEAHESNVRRGAMLDASLDAIITIDESGLVVEWNRAAEAMFGYAREEAIGKNMGELIVPATHARAHSEGIARHARTGEAPVLGQRLRLPARKRDGTIFPVELTITRAPLAGTVQFTGFVRDLTEQRRIEEALELAQRSALQSEKLAALGSLVAGVAHELRTPLAYLANNTQLLRRLVEKTAAEGRSAADIVADARAFSDETIEAVDRINRLVKDLKRFHNTRSDAKTVASLHATAADAIHLFRATHRDVTVASALEETPLVRIDAIQVQQVVLNLLENAAEATGSMGHAIRVETRRDVGGDALIIVEDRGIGIEAKDLARIYDPLFTTKREGTGLGLSIVKRIVDQHGGRIECESRPGEGTRFTVRLPAHERSVPVGTEAQREASASPQA